MGNAQVIIIFIVKNNHFFYKIIVDEMRLANQPQMRPTGIYISATSFYGVAYSVL